MAYMNTLVVNGGVRRRARLFWNIGGALANLKLHLYTNNHVPACADVLGTYAECTLSGYVALDLLGANWAETLTAVCKSAWFYNALLSWTFTAGAGATLYGGYITDNDSGLLVAAGNFVVSSTDLTPDPFTVPTTGGIFQVGLSSTDKDCSM